MLKMADLKNIFQVEGLLQNDIKSMYLIGMVITPQKIRIIA